MKRICHISSVHPALDTRVFYKECKSLAAAGYHVTLIAVTDQGQQTIDGVHIVPFPPYRNRFKRILLSPLRMLRIALKQKSPLYHFHDPELIPVGIMLKILGKKVVYDVHEDLPKQIMGKPYIRSRFVGKLLGLITRLFEWTGSLFFNRIVVVTPKIAQNFPARKTLMIRNLPELKMFHDSIQPDIQKEKPVLIYVGALTRIRGLKEVVQAMKYIGPRAHLWLLGKWESETFHNQCQQQEGWKYVQYFGQKPQKEAYGYIKTADIGIVNFLPVPNHLDAMPNKIFEYMTLGKPIVMSHFPLWQETFPECALFADPTDPADIARHVERFLDDPKMIKEMGQKGKSKVESGFSWESEEQILLNMYKDLT